MCLIYSKEETDSLIEKCKENKKTFITYYKVVQWNCVLRHTQSYLYHHVWSGGWNHANIKHYKREKLKDDDYIEYGIHVYIAKQDAIDMKNYWNCDNTNAYTILPVKCYIKDIVGVGYRLHGKDAVFTKVWVDKKELDKIRSKFK